MTTDLLQTSIFMLSLLLGATYYMTVPRHPFKLSWLIKGMSIFLLAILSLFILKGHIAILMFVALMIASFGDMFLALGDDEHYFGAGLGCFLVTHIMYTVSFVVGSNEHINSYITLMIFPLIFMATLAYGYLLSSIEHILVPVTFYIIALTMMVACALLYQSGSPLVIVGALLFFVSDLVLAINTFKKLIPGANCFTWGTYYVGQVLIVIGLYASQQ